MKWVFLVLVAAAAARASFNDATFHDVTFPESIQMDSGSRIVSGWEAVDGQIPHQISLRMVNDVGGVFSCGGSVIHHEWVLTAAHCTANRPTLVLRLGVVNVTTPSLIFESLQFYNHPLYDESIAGIVQPNDIGLIKFPFPVKYTKLIQPIRIQRSADKYKNYDNYKLIASGWGRTWTNGPSPEVMNWVHLRGVTNLRCLIDFGGSMIVQQSTICAIGYSDPTQSTCQGDSGGPLTVIDQDGKRTIVGVTSFVSSRGCHVGMPAGFIRPGWYHDWYKQVTGINFDWDFDDSSSEGDSSSEEDSSQSESEEDSEEDGSGFMAGV